MQELKRSGTTPGNKVIIAKMIERMEREIDGPFRKATASYWKAENSFLPPSSRWRKKFRAGRDNTGMAYF